jgi:hypothetical protein
MEERAILIEHDVVIGDRTDSAGLNRPQKDIRLQIQVCPIPSVILATIAKRPEIPGQHAVLEQALEAIEAIPKISEHSF